MSPVDWSLILKIPSTTFFNMDFFSLKSAEKYTWKFQQEERKTICPHNKNEKWKKLNNKKNLKNILNCLHEIVIWHRNQWMFKLMNKQIWKLPSLKQRTADAIKNQNLLRLVFVWVWHQRSGKQHHQPLQKKLNKFLLPSTKEPVRLANRICTFFVQKYTFNVSTKSLS